MVGEPVEGALKLSAVGRNFVRANDVRANDPRIRAGVASFAAGATVLAFALFDEFTDTAPSDVSFWLGLLASLGVFNALYLLLSNLATYLVERQSGRTRLTGKWHHVLSFDVDGVVKIRHGPVDIKPASTGELQFIGLNLDPKRQNAYHSNWRSLVVSLDETQVMLIFESRTPYRSPRMGLMNFDLFLSSAGYDVLVGYFSDADREGRHGHICLFKNADECAAEVARLCAATAHLSPEQNI